MPRDVDPRRSTPSRPLRAVLGTILCVAIPACLPAAAAAKGAPLAAPDEGVALNAQLSRSLILAGAPETAYLRIGLAGLQRKHDGQRTRTPVNIAIVLDKSSSMSGDKIVEAKRAAIMAVNALQPDDVVSVVTYDSTVDVVVPATRAADRAEIIAAIERIEPAGMTALFAGVSKGAAEARTFFERNRVNRIILLSDGLANVGPSSPGALAELGFSLGKEGFSVTTIGLGLGYNEDLMFQLALASDGNHAFVEHAQELATIFKAEFSDVFSVVAQDVDVRIECAPGVRPIRVLGRDALIAGNVVTARLNQLYGGQEKFLLLEVELPATAAGAQRPVASVAVEFADMVTRTREGVRGEVSVEATRSAEAAARAVDETVMVDAVALVANEQNRIAMAARDEGRVSDAKKLLEDNEEYLRSNARRYQSPKLRKLETSTKESADNLDDDSWNRTRKQMRKLDFEESMQQSY